MQRYIKKRENEKLKQEMNSRNRKINTFRVYLRKMLCGDIYASDRETMYLSELYIDFHAVSFYVHS